jgi:ankyrin repeat protein
MDATKHSLIVRNSLYDKYVALIDAISRDDEMTVHMILFSKFGDSFDY